MNSRMINAVKLVESLGYSFDGNEWQRPVQDLTWARYNWEEWQGIDAAIIINLTPKEIWVNHYKDKDDVFTNEEYAKGKLNSMQQNGYTRHYIEVPSNE